MSGEITVREADIAAAKACQIDLLIGGIQGDKEAWRKVELAFARHAAQARLDALGEAARLCKQWRDENRVSMEAASGRPRDMVEGAAIECNALMRAIRQLAGESKL